MAEIMAALQGTTAFMVRDKYSSVCCKCAEHPYTESDLRFKSPSPFRRDVPDAPEKQKILFEYVFLVFRQKAAKTKYSLLKFFKLTSAVHSTALPITFKSWQQKHQEQTLTGTEDLRTA